MTAAGSDEELALVGTTLNERYDLLALVGSGGMGAVYRARDRELDELVALKIIRGAFAHDPVMVERFRREVKLARRVTHGNVARTFELGRAGDLLFCTMELVDGEPLAHRLAREKRIPSGEAVAIACAMLDGLAAAHAVDVVHRDVKPDNVLLASDGRVVMADFGIAAVRVDERGDLSGTPAYMAPEQARGEPPTPAVDVYAAGVVLFEMVTGRRGFAGGITQILDDKQALEHLAVAANEAAPELAALIARATARDLGARIASASELRRALAPFARGARPPTAPHPTAIDPSELTTVVALVPRGEPAQMYLADAIYDELLARLRGKPRLRLLSRGDASEPASLVVELEASDVLRATVRRGDLQLVALELPLATDHVDAAADALAQAVGHAVTARVAVLRGAELEARDLLLQARHAIAGNQQRSREARTMIARARALRPDDAAIAAQFAMIDVRLAFFDPTLADNLLVEAGALARQAVAAAPQLAEAHLAIGHVELHGGNPIAAAGHYRDAIAAAPHSAEAHEYLGRMLLEAGYIDAAVGRLHEALAISPTRYTINWELARARALEGEWAECHRLVNELRTHGSDRLFLRVRFAAWQGNHDEMASLVPAMLAANSAFAGGFFPSLAAVLTGGAWPPARDVLVALAAERPADHRRRTFLAQMAAEASGYAGDVATCATLIERAIDDGLFDLHWLDRCPLLAGLRASDALPRLRAPLKRRADAILDALYGDRDPATSDTIAATS